MIKTEIYSDRLQLFDLDLEGEPDEKELAAIDAFKDDYAILEEYDMLSYARELETEFGSMNLRIRV